MAAPYGKQSGITIAQNNQGRDIQNYQMSHSAASQQKAQQPRCGRRGSAAGMPEPYATPSCGGAVSHQGESTFGSRRAGDALHSLPNGMSHESMPPPKSGNTAAAQQGPQHADSNSAMNWPEDNYGAPRHARAGRRCSHTEQGPPATGSSSFSQQNAGPHVAVPSGGYKVTQPPGGASSFSLWG